MNQNQITSRVMALALSLLPAVACSDRVQSQEDADGGDESPADLPPEDLPCGGADLQTDNDNCGECGHECDVYYEGTQWEVGGCSAGQCGTALWSGCFGPQQPPINSCAQQCEALGGECVEAGCAGVSGLAIDGPLFEGCGLYPDAPLPMTPIATCDEPFEHYQDDFVQRGFVCCCTDQ